MKTLYRVIWTKNGIDYHGDLLMEKSLAEAWVKYMNKKYPGMNHRLEPVKVEEPGIDY